MHVLTGVRCPTCNSPSPERHPAVQWEGEVHLCRDLWHSPTAAEIEARDEAPRMAAEVGTMSKASEWARRYVGLVREREVLDHDIHDMRLVWHGGAKQRQVAIVQASAHGGVALQVQHAHLSAVEAIAFARWILDTFGEASVAESPRVGQAAEAPGGLP